MTDSQKTSKSDKAECNCVTDPFADLPPEVRPPSKSRLGKLRPVICPGCGLKYWTNRLTDLCKACQKNDIKITS